MAKVSLEFPQILFSDDFKILSENLVYFIKSFAHSLQVFELISRFKGCVLLFRIHPNSQISAPFTQSSRKCLSLNVPDSFNYSCLHEICGTEDYAAQTHARVASWIFLNERMFFINPTSAVNSSIVCWCKRAWKEKNPSSDNKNSLNNFLTFNLL